MGTGAVKGHTQTQTPRTSTQSSTTSAIEEDDMPSCNNCDANFTLFRRKKTCIECGNHHCSSCLVKEPNISARQRKCKKCHMLVTGCFNRQELMALKLKELKHFLTKRKIPITHCTEKNDLVELILRYTSNEYYRQEQEAHRQHLEMLEERHREIISGPTSTQSADQSDFTSPSSSISDVSEIGDNQDAVPTGETQSPSGTTSETPAQSATQSTTTQSQSPVEEREDERDARLRERQQREMRESEARQAFELDDNDEPDPRPPKPRMTLSDITATDEIPNLSARQLKEVLYTNFVDFKGCVEKHELVERVTRLYIADQNNQTKKNEKRGSHNSNDDKAMCKICMDKVIDCVLLECGHMVTCTDCGKKMAECPICRQYIVRAVHIFHA